MLVAKGQSAAEVGDETLLLAAHAPTVVSADRAAGARLIEGTDATVIVMDDGFQNPQLAKDFSLIVVDAATGLGNGLVMPAGPLRAPLDKQMPRADALLLIGDGGKTAPLAKSFEAANKPVLKARMAPRGDARWLGILPVIGFAGIANPKKFYATLSQKRRAAHRHALLPRPSPLYRAAGDAAAQMGAGVERHAGHHREGLGAPARRRRHGAAPSSSSARGRSSSTSSSPTATG